LRELMSEVIPAIIPKSFIDLNEKLSLVKGLVPLVQIDISDGKFTTNKTWPNILNPDPDFVKIIREEEGFPFWEDIDFEIHLMVTDPESEIQKWISAGAKRIIFHYESFSDPEKVLSFVQNFKKQFGGDGSYISTELGISLKIETENNVLIPLMDYIDFVQFMSIATLGYQGAHIPFEDIVLKKISDFRSLQGDIPISVDGGINLENSKAIIDSGANRLVVGGAIFNSEDIPGTIEELKSL
jgi:ribulose-phosphate 3-epimerase